MRQARAELPGLIKDLESGGVAGVASAASPLRQAVTAATPHTPGSPVSPPTAAAAAKRRSDEKEAAARMRDKMKVERAAQQRQLSLEMNKKSPSSGESSTASPARPTGGTHVGTPAQTGAPGERAAADEAKMKVQAAQEATAQEAIEAERDAARKAPFKIGLWDLNKQKMVRICGLGL